jgi:HD-GYP domain-containing protein (c-di-GMP phosphodiesterase class II)
VVPQADTLKKIFPIKTQERCYGALWLEVPIRGGLKTHHDQDIRTLINQTAVALESSIRNAKIRDQLQELNNAYSALTETHKKLEQSHNQLSENFLETIRSLMSALEEREKETAEHNKRMEKIAVRIGGELRLNREEMHNLRYGAILHDIGKIGVSDLILLKEGNLTDHERKQMEKHAETGARIVGNIPGLAGAAEVIANHHELWNGTGYPHGLAERMIPLLARIVTVADVFDALTHDRPYRERMPVHEAISYMRQKAGIIYDPELVEILVRVLPELADEIDISREEIQV